MPNPCIYAGWLPSWKLSWLSTHPQDISRTPPSPVQPHGHRGAERIHGQKHREGNQATNLSHPSEMSQAEQSMCSRHRTGSALTHEIKSLFCLVSAIQRRTDFFRARARPRGLQLRCCTLTDLVILMDLLQTDIGKQNQFCIFVLPAPLES